MVYIDALSRNRDLCNAVWILVLGWYNVIAIMYRCFIWSDIKSTIWVCIEQSELRYEHWVAEYVHLNYTSIKIRVLLNYLNVSFGCFSSGATWLGGDVSEWPSNSYFLSTTSAVATSAIMRINTRTTFPIMVWGLASSSASKSLCFQMLPHFGLNGFRSSECITFYVHDLL